MDRKRPLHILTAVGGGFLAVAVLFGALFAIRSTGALANCTAFAPYGWVLPLLAGFIIFGVAWALSAQPRHGHDRVPGMPAVPCDACGRTVMGEWRLCPYCGTMLGKDAVEDAGRAPGVA